MIGYLRGELLRSTLQEILVLCGGVGYQLQIPLSTHRSLPEIGAVVELEVVTQVTQDSMSLVGFATKSEKELFLILYSINRIGLRMALNIISDLSPQEFVHAIQTKNIDRLAQINGIGKKTAERLIIESRDRVSKLELQTSSENAGMRAIFPETMEMALAYSALINLGFRPPESRAAILEAMQQQPPPENERELIKVALQKASKKIR